MSCTKSQYRIDELAGLVHPRNDHPKVFAMIDAYLDESGIHDGAVVCTIAGYVGGRGQMRKLEKAWNNVLQSFGFPLEKFHAKDLLKQPQHYPMLLALAKVIAQQRKIHPVSAGIIVPDFYSFSEMERRWLTGASPDSRTRKLRGGCPNKPYFVPFVFCLQRVTDYAPAGGKAHFFFGLDRQFAEYATAMFKQIKAQLVAGMYPNSEWKSKDRLGDPAFPLARETPQLQAADLLVHLDYQRMLDCYAAKDWSRPPSEILSLCLSNTHHPRDHIFQDRENLADTFLMARSLSQRTLSRPSLR